MCGHALAEGGLDAFNPSSSSVNRGGGLALAYEHSNPYGPYDKEDHQHFGNCGGGPLASEPLWPLGGAWEY